MNKCQNCGCEIKDGFELCEDCLYQTVTYGTAVKMNKSGLPEKSENNQNKSNNNNNNNNNNREILSIEPPTLWMYCVSVFFPVLQWILMGTYVSKNQTENAWELFWKPAVAQFVFVVIVVLILKMR